MAKAAKKKAEKAAKKAKKAAKKVTPKKHKKRTHQLGTNKRVYKPGKPAYNFKKGARGRTWMTKTIPNNWIGGTTWAYQKSLKWDAKEWRKFEKAIYVKNVILIHDKRKEKGYKPYMYKYKHRRFRCDTDRNIKKNPGCKKNINAMIAKYARKFAKERGEVFRSDALIKKQEAYYKKKAADDKRKAAAKKIADAKKAAAKKAAARKAALKKIADMKAGKGKKNPKRRGRRGGHRRRRRGGHRGGGHRRR